MGDHRRLDLGRLEPDAVDLQLVVHTSAVGGHPGPDDPDAVAGAIPRGGRVGSDGLVISRSTDQEAIVELDEPFGRLVVAVQIRLGHAGPTDVELPPCAGRGQVTEAVEHGDATAGSGMPDRDVGGEIDLAVPLVDHAADDRLGGAVFVEDPQTGSARVFQPFGEWPPERLTADHHRPQRPQRSGEAREQLELRRRRLQEGDPIVERDPSEGADGFLVEHDDPAAREEGQEEAGDGQVEDQRRVQGDDGRILVGVGVRRDREVEVVGQTPLRDGHPLGRTRRPGRVEEVRRIVEVDPRQGVGARPLRRRLGTVRCFGAVGQSVEDEQQVGVGGDPVVAGRGVVGGQQDEHPTGSENPLDGDQHVQATRHSQADGTAGYQPRAQEPMGELVGPMIELGGTEGRAAVLGDDPFRIGAEPPPDPLVDRLVVLPGRRIGIEQSQLGAFDIVDDGLTADPVVGPVEHGGDHRGEMGREAFRRVVVADRHVEVELPLQSRNPVGGGAGVVEHLGAQDVAGINVARAHPLGHGGHAREVSVPSGQHVEHDLERGVGALARLRAPQQGHDRAEHPGEQRVMGVVVLDRDGERVELHQRSDELGGVTGRAVMDRNAQDDAGASVEPLDRRSP